MDCHKMRDAAYLQTCIGSRTLQMVRQKIAEVNFIVNMAYNVFHEWYENYYLCLASICF